MTERPLYVQQYLAEGYPQCLPPEGMETWPRVESWTPSLWSWWMRQGGASDDEVHAYLGDLDAVTTAITVNGTRVIWYRATPKGAQFHRHQAPTLLFGGAAGGAKSKTLREDAYRNALATPHYRAILFRRTIPELKRSHIDKAKQEWDSRNRTAQMEIGRVIGDEEVRFHNGSLLVFAHCQNPGDEAKYLSDEWDWIGIDELATFERDQAIGIMSRTRSTKEGIRAVVRCSTNPAGSQTKWVKQLFIDKSVNPREFPMYDPAQYGFIPSKLFDNPYLMDPDGTWATYAANRLGMFSPIRRRQMLDGDWSALEGAFFAEFDPAVHIQDYAPTKGQHAWMTIDYGWNKGCVLWVLVLPDHRLHVISEDVHQHTLVKDVVRRCKKRESELGIRVQTRPADPALWGKRGHTGESEADTFARYGLALRKSDNDRIPGWVRLRHYLACDDQGRPYLTMSPSCRYLIESFQAAVTDPTNPNDLDTHGDDHGLDALRYLVMARPSPGFQSLTAPAPAWSTAWIRSHETSLRKFARRRRVVVGY